MIAVGENLADWRAEPAYVEAYEALHGEFALASAMIQARSDMNISQRETAKRMNTSQPAAVRLESGHGNPSIETLQGYAAATGTRLPHDL